MDAPDDQGHRVPRADELVQRWLEEDVYAAGGPLRSELEGLAIPRTAAVRRLGAEIVRALGTGRHDGVAAILDDPDLHGFPDDALVHAVQLMVRRAQGALAGADPDALARRHDRLIRVVLRSRLARMRDAMPADGGEFLELASVVTDTLYSTLSSGVVRYVSPGIEELTGHPPAAFLEDQHLWARLVEPEDLPTMERLFREVAARGEAMEAVYRVRHRDGQRVRHVLDRVTPVVVDGRTVRIDGILIDITERIELEVRLERSEQLRSLGQLARDVAHDFNNLLVSIIGHADLLLARIPPEGRDAHALRLIAAAADKGSKLTERLLAFARGASTSGTKSPVQLERLAHDTIELARPSVPPGLRLELSVSAGVPAVDADDSRVGEALLNLVLNALQACGDGQGGRVDVVVRPASVGEATRIGESTGVVVEVVDDGPGMTPEVLGRVFEPMFTTRGREGGTGLGCAMAFGVAIDHDGLLEVESEPGRGATFRLILPVTGATSPAEPAPTTRRTEARRATLEARSQPERDGPRILVVDDEPSVRQLLKDLLEGAGYRVETASSGRDAIARVDADPDTVDLVVLDVMMHPVDGTAAFAALRESHASLPMIFCTGHSDATRITVPSALEQATIVQKPFRVAQLIRAVRQALGA